MRRYCLLLIAILFLSGCTHYAPPYENHPVRVVTAIDVTTTQQGEIYRFRYSSNEKMEAILKYLRSLEPDQFTPIEPDSFRTDAYEIILTLSDGSKTVYHQIYDEYLKKDNGRWQAINRAKGASLPQLLAGLPSDSL